MNERIIFDAALEIDDVPARRAFVEQACAGNEQMRAAVEALLKSHEAAGSFLNVPIGGQMQGERMKPDSTKDGHSLGSSDSNSPSQVNDPADKTQVYESGIHKDDDADDESSPDLSFLQPSSKSGSIGLLGHYEVLRVLGQGGFGIVLKAFDEKLHRHVAIKVMNAQMAATSPPRKRFLREARAAAAIRHENIVQVYSVEEQPLPYLVMEFIDGPTLQQKQAGHGPLEVPEWLHIGRQIAAGLASAHATGLIHRDIKPGNVLIEEVDGRGLRVEGPHSPSSGHQPSTFDHQPLVKITDFGLARAADDASLSRSGTISGTPMYMAPEQALGHTLDHRADLFSMGSVLYELATGRPPFRAANTIAVLRRVVDDTPRPMQEIIPELPDWLVTIVNKLLSKQPDDRYQSAKEVADLLARCQSELQLNGQVTCVPGAGSVSARSTPHRVPKSSETSELSPRANAPKLSRPPLATKTKFLLGWLAILACLPVLWYTLNPSPKPPQDTPTTPVASAPGVTIDRSGSRQTSADPSEDGRSLTTSATNWTNLFDGTTTTGWKTLGPFQVGDGLLKASGHGVAVTEKSYDNFELELEWRVVAGGNSGVYYRANPEKPGTSYTFPGTEFQLLDNAQHPDGQNPKTSAGALYGVIPPEGTFTKPAGEWNTSRIVARGPQVEHWVNDQKVLSYDMDSDAWRQALTTAKNADIATNAASRAGVIALQGHTGEIAFRQIRIREIPTTGVDTPVISASPFDIAPIVNDSTLTPEEKFRRLTHVGGLVWSSTFTPASGTKPLETKPLAHYRDPSDVAQSWIGADGIPLGRVPETLLSDLQKSPTVMCLNFRIGSAQRDHSANSFVVSMGISYTTPDQASDICGIFISPSGTFLAHKPGGKAREVTSDEFRFLNDIITTHVLNPTVMFGEKGLPIPDRPAVPPKSQSSSGKFPPLAPGWFERVSKLPPEEQVKGNRSHPVGVILSDWALRSRRNRRHDAHVPWQFTADFRRTTGRVAARVSSGAAIGHRPL